MTKRTENPTFDIHTSPKMLRVSWLSVPTLCSNACGQSGLNQPRYLYIIIIILMRFLKEPFRDIIDSFIVYCINYNPLS